MLPMQVQQKTTERNTFLEENLAKVRLRFSQETELDDERAQELITETIFDDPEAFCMAAACPAALHAEDFLEDQTQTESFRPTAAGCRRDGDHGQRTGEYFCRTTWQDRALSLLL